MGLFGGSSQSTSSSSNVLDFAPIFNIGDGIESSQEKKLDQTTSTSPRLDDSFGLSASVGVGVGGQGSGGLASTSRSQTEDHQPLNTKTVTEGGQMQKYTPLLALGGVGMLAFYLINKKGK